MIKISGLDVLINETVVLSEFDRDVSFEIEGQPFTINFVHDQRSEFNVKNSVGSESELIFTVFDRLQTSGYAYTTDLNDENEKPVLRVAIYVHAVGVDTPIRQVSLTVVRLPA